MSQPLLHFTQIRKILSTRRPVYAVPALSAIHTRRFPIGMSTVISSRKTFDKSLMTSTTPALRLNETPILQVLSTMLALRLNETPILQVLSTMLALRLNETLILQVLRHQTGSGRSTFGSTSKFHRLPCFFRFTHLN